MGIVVHFEKNWCLVQNKGYQIDLVSKNIYVDRIELFAVVGLNDNVLTDHNSYSFFYYNNNNIFMTYKGNNKKNLLCTATEKSLNYMNNMI